MESAEAALAASATVPERSLPPERRDVVFFLPETFFFVKVFVEVCFAAGAVFFFVEPAARVVFFFVVEAFEAVLVFWVTDLVFEVFFFEVAFFFAEAFDDALRDLAEVFFLRAPPAAAMRATFLGAPELAFFFVLRVVFFLTTVGILASAPRAMCCSTGVCTLRKPIDRLS